jgi:hypothetical protein
MLGRKLRVPWFLGNRNFSGRQLVPVSSRHCRGGIPPACYWAVWKLST